MYAVIFRARAGAQDAEYGETVKKMRELAFSTYGCLEFVALTEGDQEIAISYWRDEESIRRWREDAAHKLAQQRGKAKWYASYRVEVAEITHHYHFPDK